MAADRTATELPEGTLVTDKCRDDGTVVHALSDHALLAMDRAVAKRAAPCSIADAQEEWLVHVYRGWARARLVEHYYGLRCWGAFGDTHFALFRRQSLLHHITHEVLEDVSARLAQGGENLDIINWAISEDRDVDAILWLLDRVDINAQRQRLLTDHIRNFLHTRQTPRSATDG